MSVRFGKAVPLPSPGSDPVQHPRQRRGCSRSSQVCVSPSPWERPSAQPLVCWVAMETGIIPSPLSRARPGLAL